jgi:hypothetical protein
MHDTNQFDLKVVSGRKYWSLPSLVNKSCRENGLWINVKGHAVQKIPLVTHFRGPNCLLGKIPTRRRFSAAGTQSSNVAGSQRRNETLIPESQALHRRVTPVYRCHTPPAAGRCSPPLFPYTNSSSSSSSNTTAAHNALFEYEVRRYE